MEDCLLDPWLKEAQEHLQGLSITGLESLQEGVLQLTFGRRYPRLLFQLQPQRIWYCFSRRIGISKKAKPIGPAEELLRGGRLGSISRVPGERILLLPVAAGGGGSCFQIVVELMPGSPNLILLKHDELLVWMLNPDRMPGRALRPGHPYHIPNRPPRLALQEALKNPPAEGESIQRWLLRHVDGVSPLAAAELVRRAAGAVAALPEAYHDLVQEPLSPHIYSEVALHPLDLAGIDPWKQITVSAWQLAGGPADFAARYVQAFAAANEALESFAEIALLCREFQTLRDKLLAATQARVHRLTRAQAAANQDLGTMEHSDRYRLSGELLLCHLGLLQQQGAQRQIPVRALELQVINHYGGPGTTLSIPVDPGKSLQDNADAYFRTYRKAQRGLKLVQARLQDLHRQLELHQALHQAVCCASDLTRLQTLEAQILPCADARRKAAKVQHEEKRQRRSYVSSEGYEILVGQNASNNEEITFRLAAATDTWLHVADYAGSHVIIRNPSRLEVPAPTLLEAAGLAAFYSAARKQSRVEVRYTQRKFVHKLKGAAPGLVRLQNYKTLYVEPSRRIGGPGPASSA